MAGGPQIENGRTIGVLRRQLEAALAERDEARAQQTAMTEVLRAINESSGDFKPVFDLITEKVLALCDAPRGALITYDGTFAVAVSQRNLSPAFAQFWNTPQRLEPTSHIFRL